MNSSERSRDDRGGTVAECYGCEPRRRPQTHTRDDDMRDATTKAGWGDREEADLRRGGTSFPPSLPESPEWTKRDKATNAQQQKHHRASKVTKVTTARSLSLSLSLSLSSQVSGASHCASHCATHCAVCLAEREVVCAVDRARVHAGLVGEQRRSAVPLVDVEVHDRDAPHPHTRRGRTAAAAARGATAAVTTLEVAAERGRGRHGEVVQNAEARAEVGVRVVRPAGEVGGEPVPQRELRGENGPGGLEPRALDERVCVRVVAREADAPHPRGVVRERYEPPVVLARVHRLEVLVGERGGGRAEELVGAAHVAGLEELRREVRELGCLYVGSARDEARTMTAPTTTTEGRRDGDRTRVAVQTRLGRTRMVRTAPNKHAGTRRRHDSPIGKRCFAGQGQL